MKDTQWRFSPVSIALHWLIAVAVIIMLAVGLYLDEMPKGPAKTELLAMHKSFGAVLLLLTLIRLFWRWLNGMPRPLVEPSAAEALVAKVVLATLLIGTVLMPLSGIAMSVGAGYGLTVFGWEIIGRGDKLEWLAELGKEGHEVIANLLFLAILLHVLAAIKHRRVGDGTVERMLGKAPKDPDSSH